MHTPLVTAFGTQRQVDFYECKVNQGDLVRPYLKTNKQTPYNMNSELRVREDRKEFWVSSLSTALGKKPRYQGPTLSVVNHPLGRA